MIKEPVRGQNTDKHRVATKRLLKIFLWVKDDDKLEPKNVTEVK